MNNKRYRIGDLVEYILKNRRGKAFIGWSKNEITLALMDAVEEGTLLYSIDKEGNIDGVAQGKLFNIANVMHVHNILTTSKGAFIALVKAFNQQWPGCQLEGYRRGKRKLYKTEQFIHKVLGAH